ncbi:MAG: DUF4298 domain-containing protein [Carnobacterium sp.]|nr:DUF4298 domain-containing protein [Carnobacterium sp.]
MTQDELTSDQFKQIKKMQKILSELEKGMNEFEIQLDDFEAKQKSLQQLSKYYGSETWFEDIKSYDEGNLPKGHNYSVLGEDPVFDVIGDNYRMAIRLLEVATEIIKNH